MKTIIYALWISSRPKTLIATLSPVAIGLCISSIYQPLNIFIACITMISALCIQIGTNFANDYFDHKHGTDTDERLGPKRGLHQGLLTINQLKWATIGCFLIGVLTGLFLIKLGGILFLWVGLISIAVGILYTAGPLPLGYIGLGDLMAGLFFGPVAVIGTIYLQLFSIPIEGWWMSIGPAAYSVALISINNCRDFNEDRQTGKRTLAVLLGQRFVKCEFTLMIILAWLSLFWMPQSSALPVILGSIGGISIGLILACWKTPDQDLNRVLALTGAGQWMWTIGCLLGWLL